MPLDDLFPGWKYILDDEGEPVPVRDVIVWAEWMNTADRTVLRESPRPGVTVSTVFLSLDHGFGRFGRDVLPVLWETMIFGSVFDNYQRRFTSRLDALQGHVRAVALVELYATAPRRLKKSLKKGGRADRRLGRRERRRLARALRIVDETTV